MVSAAELRSLHAQQAQAAAPAANGTPALGNTSNGTGTGSAAHAAAPKPMDDPFPALSEDPFPAAPAVAHGAAGAAQAKAQPRNVQPDLSSQSAFPSLGGSAPAPKGQWGARLGTPAASSPRGASPAPSSGRSTPLLAPGGARRTGAATPVTQDTFSVPTPTDPAKLGQVMSRVKAKHRTVKVEASSTRKSGTTTFVLKGPTESAVKAARKDLTIGLAKMVTLTVMIPSSLQGFVIGAKGKNIKAITEATGVRINIPREEGDAAASNGAKPQAPAPTPGQDYDYDADTQIAVTIDGDEINAQAAARQIRALVAERTSRSTQRLTHIDHVLYPFIAGARGANASRLEAEVGAADVSVRVPPRAAFLPPREREEEEEDRAKGAQPRERDLSIIVSGDKDQVAKVVAAIEEQVQEMKRSFRTLAISIPKRQHRFLVGDAAQEILASTGCSVELAAQEDVSDQVTIRGPPAKLPLALTAAMEKASAVRVESVEVSSAHRGAPPEHARRLLRWLSLGGKIPRPAGVQVFLPRNALAESADAAAPLSIDIVGADAEAVSNVRAQLETLVRSVPPSFVKIIDVDPLLHRFIIGKQGKGLQTYAKRGVDVIFPPAPSATNEAGTGAEGRSDVVLVLADASQLAEGDAKAKNASAEALLQSIAEEVQRAAGQAADLTTEVLNVPQRFHSQILGSKGTTLNAILGTAGEERLVSVRMGQGRGPPTAGAPAPSPADDTITVRGPSAEVARVVAELQKVAKDVQEDAIVNGHVAEFSVDAEHVRHLVGRAGAAVAKLREELGVRIDFDDAPEAGASKGPKAKGAKTKVTITGRQENVKACKERILAQAAQLADETTITLKVPQSMHGSIIGSGGKYVTRLQDNYGVRVNFPSQNAEKADEVTIRGGKKGVEEARREIVELLQYEEANNQQTTVVVSRSSIARIMGKGGATVNKIRDDTEAQIDVDRASDDAEGATTTIRIRGTKKAIDAARGAILAIAKDVDAEETFSLNIPSRFHGLLLGSGGQNLRDIIARASGGGSGDDQARLGAQLVQFPRRGDKNADPDTVIVRGPGDVARKVKDELAAAAAELADRVTVGTVVAPASQRGLMAALRELQSTHNIRILMPSFREFAAAKEEAVNSAETADAADGSVVLLVGKRAQCDAAATEIAQRFTAHSEQVSISRAAHAKLANQQFFRSLRASGVSADAPRVAPVAAPAAEAAPAPSASAATARIDLDDAADLGAGDEDEEFGFTIVELPPVTGEDVTWTLTASSREVLAAGVARLRAEADETGAHTHEGRMTVDSSVVPRLVGKQGSALKQHEEASGAHIDIPRAGNGTVILRGTRDQVLAAKERIVRAASAPARRRD